MTVRQAPVRHRPLAAVLLVLALVWSACGSTTPTPTPRDPSGIPSASAVDPGSSPTPLPEVELPGEIEAGNIQDHLRALQDIADANGGVRTIGTPGYEQSVDYVVGQLESFGYDVETPEFTTGSFEELPGGRITVEDDGPVFTAGDDFHAMIYSAGGDVTAEVATVGFPDSPGGEGNQSCSADDWEAFPEGAIALAAPGPCRRRDAVEHAQEAGAVAIVTAYDQWEPGEARRPTLIFPDGIDIPVISAVGEVGEALQGAADDGTEVHIEVETEIRTVTLRNVIAEAGSGGPVAMIGGHLDGVHDGPGLNDNGSGVSAILEIARVMAGSVDEGTIRFGFWGAEEFGLHGSRDYVVSGAGSEVSAYLNLDMLGSVNGVPFVYRDAAAASGSRAIGDFLIGWLEQHGHGAEPEDLGGGSDHYFFAEDGIPTGGIFSGASELKSADQAQRFGGEAGQPMDPCYHLACDTIDNVDADQVALYAEAAARAALLIARGELLEG